MSDFVVTGARLRIGQVRRMPDGGAGIIMRIEGDAVKVNVVRGDVEIWDKPTVLTWPSIEFQFPPTWPSVDFPFPPL